MKRTRKRAQVERNIVQGLSGKCILKGKQKNPVCFVWSVCLCIATMRPKVGCGGVVCLHDVTCEFVHEVECVLMYDR